MLIKYKKTPQEVNCEGCGRFDVKYWAKGLCSTCYNTKYHFKRYQELKKAKLEQKKLSTTNVDKVK